MLASALLVLLGSTNLLMEVQPSTLASSAGPDFYSFLLAPTALASQCTNPAATTSNQGDTITCTRASTAFCSKDDGSIVTTSIDRCRVSGRGLAREPAATNIALRSAELGNGVWSLFLATLTGTNVGVFADGNTTMEQLTSSDGSGIAYQALTVSSSVGPFSASGYFSKASGTGYASIALACTAGAAATCTCEREDGTACTAEMNGAGAASTPGLCLGYSIFGTTAKKLSVTMTCAGAETSLYVSVHGGQRHPGGTGSYGGVAYVGGVQAEVGPVSTSYIATAGTSVTRSAETITTTLPTSIDSAGCIGASVTYGTLYPGNSALISTDGLTLSAASATSLTLNDGTATATATIASLLGRATPIRGFWTGTSMGVAAGGTSAMAAWDGAATSNNVVTLGGTNFAGYFSAVRANVSPYGCGR